MPITCDQIKSEYESIKALKQRYDLEYQKAEETGDFTKVKEYRALLEIKREALSSKLWAFETLSQKELAERYEWQKDVLLRLGLLETLSNGELGIKGLSPNSPKYLSTF